jgi:hypothetical protein
MPNFSAPEPRNIDYCEFYTHPLFLKSDGTFEFEDKDKVGTPQFCDAVTSRVVRLLCDPFSLRVPIFFLGESALVYQKLYKDVRYISVASQFIKAVENKLEGSVKWALIQSLTTLFLEGCEWNDDMRGRVKNLLDPVNLKIKDIFSSLDIHGVKFLMIAFMETVFIKNFNKSTGEYNLVERALEYHRRGISEYLSDLDQFVHRIGNISLEIRNLMKGNLGDHSRLYEASFSEYLKTSSFTLGTYVVSVYGHGA